MARPAPLSPAVLRTIAQAGSTLLAHGLKGNLVQFSTLPTPAQLQSLDGLLARLPRVGLRTFGFGSLANVDFLAALPHARKVVIDHYPIHDWSGLLHLTPAVRELSIRSYGKPPRLADLGRATGLRKVQVAQACGVREYVYLGQLRNLRELRLEKARLTLQACQALGALSNLEVLQLRGGSVADWGFLERLPRLRELRLVGGRDVPAARQLVRLTALRRLELHSMALASLGWLPQLPGLEALSLSGLSGIRSLAPVARLRNLRELFLGSWSGATLPPLTALTQLQSLGLSGLPKLCSLTRVPQLPALRRLTVLGMPQLAPEHFRPLMGHPQLRDLHLGLGSVRKQRAVHQLLGI